MDSLLATGDLQIMITATMIQDLPPHLRTVIGFHSTETLRGLHRYRHSFLISPHCDV